MKIDNEFTVSVPIEQAWQVLTDLEGIAPCLPGAQVTGRDGDNFTGKVKITVGPVVSEYAGAVHFVEKDGAAYRAVIDAKGKDSRGAGNASALITAQLTPQGEHTLVSVDTDMMISGKVAQLGSGMIKEVSAKLLGQFVNCLETKLAASTDSVAEPAPASESAPAPSDSANTGAAPAPTTATSASAPGPAPVRTVTPTPEPAALDLMDLAGGAIYRRLLPVAIGAAVVVAAVIIYRFVR